MSEKHEIMSAAEPTRSGSLSRSGSLDGVQAGKVLQVNLEDEHLYSMGYEQHMRRGFNAWSMTAFCLTGLGLLPSIGGEFSVVVSCWCFLSLFVVCLVFLSLFLCFFFFLFSSSLSFCSLLLPLFLTPTGTLWYSMGYLGLMPMTWGWLAAAFFIMSMVMSLAEMSSSMPTAGGL